MRTCTLDEATLVLHDPVPVAVSEPGEKRWGFHQFPAISRLPGGRLLVTFNDRPDRDEAYGTPGPAYVSSDSGWIRCRPDSMSPW